MVFSWNFKQVVKKKNIVSEKDKKDWQKFIKQTGNISPKESDLQSLNTEFKRVRKFDLHGYSLSEANKIVKQFINDSFNKGFQKLLVVTGKGLRSKSYKNPYISEQFSVLKYSVPEFIKNEKDLSDKIARISNADLKDGGDGAIYIFLKKNKKIIR